MVASTKILEEPFFCPDSTALSRFVHRMYPGVPDVDARQGADPLPLLWRKAGGTINGSGQEDSVPEMSDGGRNHSRDGDAITGSGGSTVASSAIGSTA
jgi:hypothetical protein